MKFDILIIGGGPGGYVSAIRAAQLGAKVCVVEYRELGGTCLNRGCIPTKALYKSAEVLKMTRKLEVYGLEGTSAKANIDKVQKRKNDIVSQLCDGIQMLLAENGVTVINGKASFIDNKKVKVELTKGGTEELTADSIIIATGSSPFIPDIDGKDLPGVVTTDDILNIDYIPKKLAVIGGGVVGVEFAGIFKEFGSDITIINRGLRLLERFDIETISKFTEPFEKQGIKIIQNTSIKSVKRVDNILVVTSEHNETKEEVYTEADVVLLSAGRCANIKGLNLDNAGIKYTNRGIIVDDNYQTNVPNVYAIGDVLGKIMLAYVASEQGIRLIEHIVNGKKIEPLPPIPSSIFSFPEISTAGKSEEEVKEEGIDYSVGRFAFASNGKALTMSETEGFIKVISDNKTDKILGVSIVGPHASDLIHEGIVSITNNLTIDNIIHSVHSHPTLAETFSEAAMDAHNISLHSIPKHKLSVKKEASLDEENFTSVKMPKLNNMMQEGTIQEWLKQEGDIVKEGDVICVIEGTKITGEHKSPVSGVLSKIILATGEKTEIDNDICIINIDKKITLTDNKQNNTCAVK